MIPPPSTVEPCPGDETLAAFVEDSLNGAERSRVSAHLSACPACRELVVAAARVAQDLRSEEGRAPARSAGGRQRWLALAAAVLLSVGTAAYWNGTRPRPLGEHELVALLDHGAGASHLWTGGVERGPSLSAGLTAESFRFGALLVDLRVSLLANDGERARQRLQLAAFRLQPLDFMEEEARFFADARRRAESAQNLPAIAAELAAREPLWSDRLDGAFLAFGRWAEAGRLAAASRRPRLLEAAPYRRFPRWLEAEAGHRLTPDTRAALASSTSLLERGSWDEAHLAQIEGAFTRLIESFDQPR